MKRFIIFICTLLLLAVGAQVNAKRVTVDFTGSWQLVVDQYLFDAEDGELLIGPTRINLPVDGLIGDQKPNGTFTGTYSWSPGFIEYGTWEDIGDAVVYSINSDNVEDGLHAYYTYEDGPDSQLVEYIIVESMGYTIYKNDHDVGYGSVVGLKYTWNPNINDYDVARMVRTYTIYRYFPDPD